MLDDTASRVYAEPPNQARLLLNGRMKSVVHARYPLVRGFPKMRLIRLLKRWRRRQERTKHALRDTYVYRLLGERIFHHHVWVFDKRSLAGGLSLGLFVAFTPSIGFQMFICAIAAIPLRVNLPIALAACWITNPLTAFPIYAFAVKIGRLLLEHTQFLEFALGLFVVEGKTRQFVELGIYLWTGCLLIAIVTAVLGNVAVRLLWNWRHNIKLKSDPH